MFTHFTDIINGLKSLGKLYTNSDLIKKNFRYLSRIQEAKIAAIQDTKDLNELTLEELISLLMTHKLNILKNIEKESQKKKDNCLQIYSKEDESDESKEGDAAEDIELITRKFKQFMKEKRQRFKRKSLSKREANMNKENELLCNECNQHGYSRVDCPLLERIPKKMKKKSMMAIWGNSNKLSSEKEEERRVNPCLMTHEDKINFEH